MKLGFVILNYNTFEDTKKCILSIKKYVGLKESEYIITVVDNKSIDDSLVKIKSFFKDWKNVKICEAKDNLGFAKGNNLGIDFIRKKYNPAFYAVINSDTELLHHNFYRQIKESYAKNHFAVLGPKILNSDGSCTTYPWKPTTRYQVENNYKIFSERQKFIDKHLLAIYRAKHKINTVFSRILEDDIYHVNLDPNIFHNDVEVHGSFVIFSRDGISKIKGFDDRTFLYFEEQLLFIKVKNAGLHSIYEPNIKILHKGGSSTGRNKNKTKKIIFDTKNMLDSLTILKSEIEKQPLNFVTIFPKLESLHLQKDVGQLPKNLAEHNGYKSTIVCNKNANISKAKITEHLTTANNAVIVEKTLDETKTEYDSTKEYIINNATDIDILNLYHYSWSNVKLLNLYKRLNPYGIAFLKMDVNISDYDSVKKSQIKNSLRRRELMNIDIITAESMTASKKLSEFYGVEIKYLPNGYYYLPIKNNYLKQKNVFLSVGRLGTEQKNTKDLVEAYRKIIDKCDYDLWLVGSITTEFKKYLDDLYVSKKYVKRIKYFGEIDNKKELYNIYDQAKIFVLPSINESFGLVVAEAASRGNYVILSDKVSPAPEFTEHGKYGAIVESKNITKLSVAMLKATQVKINPADIAKHAKDNFSWEIIADKFSKYINSL